MEAFFKALGVLNYYPEAVNSSTALANIVWRDYSDTIYAMISWIEEYMEEYPKDLIKSYKEFVFQDEFTSLEDPQEVWDNIEGILNEGNLYDAFGSEGWKHIMGWSD